MAEHTIESRILLRYDTLTNWMSSELILKPGEVAIATAPFSTAVVSSDSTPANTPPAVGLKVGDGKRYFYELPWVQAVAADVYNWAKQQTKPTYNANEIEGLTTFIQEHTSGGGGGSGGDVTVAARVYKLVQGNNNRYYLAYREADSENWTTDTSVYIDLAPLAQIQQWIGDDLTEYFSLYGRIYGVVYDQFAAKKYEDSEEAGKVVTAVSQNRGLISVTKKSLNLNELQGPLNILHGGTGITSIGENEVLVGNASGIFTKRTIDTVVDANTNLVTNAAIKTYVDQKTAGLTGAMHFIGEATVEITNGSNVNPRISGYNFSQAQPGDVILFSSAEYVWNGSTWTLLGDESSYAIKGSITNNDIAENANISQSKIENLDVDLNLKVDKEEGKGLSSNNFTTEYKNKLDDIEEYAQRNIIEHIYVNGTKVEPTTVDGNNNAVSLRVSALTPEEEEKIGGIEAHAQVNKIEHIFLNNVEISPTTVNNLTKSVNLLVNSMTDAERTKLAGIESGAQVNTIEKIIFDNQEFTPNEEKTISIISTPPTINLTVDTAIVAGIGTWQAGRVTQMTIENNTLKIENGSLPLLTEMRRTVVTGVTQG